MSRRSAALASLARVALIALAAAGPSQAQPVETPAPPSSFLSPAYVDEGERLVPRFAGGEPAEKVRMELNRAADQPFRLEDKVSGVWVEVTLAGAARVEGDVRGGVRVFAQAVPGGDVVQVVEPGAVEDFVAFARAPQARRLSWRVTLSEAVAGLRLVEGTLELLDSRGSPRLRARAPWIRGGDGRVEEPVLALEGCAFDADPRGPWGRPVTPPGRRACTVTVRWSERVAYPALLDPSWTSTEGKLTAKRCFFALAALPNGQALAFGGTNDFTSSLKTAELFNPVDRTWAATGSMAAQRYYPRPALIGGKVLAIGGDDATIATALASTERYDPGTGGWTGAGSLSVPRAFFAWDVLVTQGGEEMVVVAGGQSTGGPSSTSDVYTLAGGWRSPNSNLSGPRNFPIGKAVGSRFYLYGGSDGTSVQTAGLVFDADGGPGLPNGRWFPFGATAPAGFMCGNAVVVTSGGPKVLFIGTDATGGCGAAGSAVTGLLDPATGSWTTPAPGMPTARHSSASVTLKDGRALATGGMEIANFSTAKTDLFSPSTLGWSAGDAMTIDRRMHEAVLLTDGRVLVAGGYANTGAAGVLDTSELWPLDPPGTACTAVAKSDGGVGGTSCASNVCVSGVCCSTACGGPCQRCDSPAGTCSNAAAGTAVGACGAYLCNGGPGCPTSCASDANCAAGYRCQGTQCVPKASQGQGCDAGVQCQASLSCVSGYCCASSCTGACQTCASPPGTCSVLGAGTAPVACQGFVCDGVSGTCPTSCTGDPQCLPPLKCLGGTCKASFDAGVACTVNTACASTFCRNGVCCASDCGPCGDCATTPGTCSPRSAGTEVAGCPGYACDGASSACPTSCASDAQCAAGFACTAGACVAKLQPAATCTRDGECGTGHCADRVCCDKACTGACDACDQAATKGTCTSLPRGSAPPVVGACGVYACAGTADCLTTCAADSDCVAPSTCVNGACSGGGAADAGVVVKGHVGFSCGCDGVAEVPFALLGLWAMAWRSRRGRGGR